MDLMRQNTRSGRDRYPYNTEFVLWYMCIYRRMNGHTQRTNDWRGRTNEGTREAK